ncbi:hypothetical protein [Prochlorococcus sp. MIT 1300]|uniref:O-linked N-acetylglucosamine transferase family protein n=1 Tax=Prochlorococcus sp. MIT 1300 TaxID=3096218 RepID=UPI002A76279A|nr:hypothetical protein [Prochlorococcus sp. MIT 1300]
MSASFHRLEKLLFGWPDELPKQLPTTDLAVDASCYLRRQDWTSSEAILLSGLALDPDDLELFWLLIFLRLSESRYLSIPDLLKSVEQYEQHQHVPFWYLKVQFRLTNRSNLDLDKLYPLIEKQTNSELLRQLSLIAIALRLCDFKKVEFLVTHFSGPNCLEFLRLKARFLEMVGNGKESLSIVSKALNRFPTHRGLARQTSIHAINAKDSKAVIPALRVGVSHHGEVPSFLTQIVQVKLMQRQPSLGRRAALVDSTWSSIDSHQINVANHVSTYEHCGNVEWFPWLLPSLRDPWFKEDFDIGLLTNLNLQYASIESPIASELATSFCNRLASLPLIAAQLAQAPQAQAATLPKKIAWVSGDIAYHPVSRFLHSFLRYAHTVGSQEHVIVCTEDHLEHSLASHFEALKGVDVLDLAPIPKQNRVPFVREHNIDIAVDLSGWTGGCFQPGFLARMAPLQINYLGYFASTGNPSTDYWLGDENLFPNPMSEWHTEKLHRLDRCFLAWEPSQIFPESQVDVTEAPKGGIRFGSFNHNRKLSDATLALWGQILESIPDSRLVLKANVQTDQGTQELLRRRMIRQGLDPQKVIWLPLADSSHDHLAQYANIDVALDCFPNGGCTTTCEALWMGVPVITLTGNTYVSRMSTAVLKGADLGEWCVNSKQEYLNMAIAQAQQLNVLRLDRDKWRNHIKNNPIGDAHSLMASLLSSFNYLYSSISSI